MASAAFVQLILTAVPLPGGTGGAEGGFALFFGGLLGDLTGTGIVLWRLISFYLPVLVSFPLLAMRSSMGPAARLETYGEAKVGREALAQDMRTAHERAGDARRQAGEKIDRVQERAQMRRDAAREAIREKAGCVHQGVRREGGSASGDEGPGKLDSGERVEGAGRVRGKSGGGDRKDAAPGQDEG